MTEIILGFNWIAILLLFFTCTLVINDRAFSKRVRIDFILIISVSMIISLLGQHLSLNHVSSNGMTEHIVFMADAVLRPFIVLIMIDIIGGLGNIVERICAVVYLIDIVLGLTYQLTPCFVVFVVFLILFIVSIIIKGHSDSKDEHSDYIFAGIVLFIMIASVWSEVFFRNARIINDALSVVVCIFYYYCVMRKYKRDGLTGLLMRHNLNYEIADLTNQKYDIVLIDVDNFKLINDKYGHDKGDEVLIDVVNTVNAHLPKGARMYRFGGDEFVIISKLVSTEILSDYLETANNILASKDLHISYGIVTHMPGDDGAEALTSADKVMYENKRLLKSEDIWDIMTGLFNYRGFMDELDTVRKTPDSEKPVICLVGVDIEHLNNINMAYGYTEGNYVIATLARVLKNSLRGRDFIGHLGSDEFVVAVECAGSDDDYIETYMESLQEGMDSAYELAEKDYTIKLNVAKYVVDIQEVTSSEDCVNNVLYIKQEEKDNRRKTDVGDGDTDYNTQDEQLVMDILDNNLLSYAYQPIVSTKDGSIIAYEALMRSTTETMVSPLKILKYAERNKRNYDVERATFFNVFGQISKPGVLPDGKMIFINSMPGYFLNDEDYAELKSKYGAYFGRMVVEITEQRELNDELLVSINSKRDIDSFNLAIDDYGSGCSNTNSILRYMPQIIKLDRLLITGIDRNAKKQFFVNSIISFARENDMIILAEGVETEKELKTVIRLGVDLVQGYFTAKPAFEIIEAIPEDIQKIIIDENLRVGSNQRMVYTAAGSCELSVVHMAMEDYSKINISGEYVTLNGSADYTADMVIRIKDNTDCHLTLADVRLNSVDDEPCIDIGIGSNLTLNLEGHNRLNAKGIHVPEGSSLTIVGSGDLDMSVQGHNCYAIGTDTESEYGRILLKNSGKITLNVDGEECVGIGGGSAGENAVIDFRTGSLDLTLAGVEGVGIGCYQGLAHIILSDCDIDANFRVNIGTVIGSMDGPVDICVKNFKYILEGSGSEVSGLGSVRGTSGPINMTAGEMNIKLSGHNIYILGSEKGNTDITISHARIVLLGEGDNVVGIGTSDKAGSVSIEECSLDLVINASNPLGFGTNNRNIRYIGPVNNVRINGVPETVEG